MRVLPRKLIFSPVLTAWLALGVGAALGATTTLAAESLQKAEAPVPPAVANAQAKEAPPENFLAARTPEELYPTTVRFEKPDFHIRKSALWGMYAGGYAIAWKTGTRHGIENNFRMMRLESAYGYDFVAHVYATRQMGLVFTSIRTTAFIHLLCPTVS